MKDLKWKNYVAAFLSAVLQSFGIYHIHAVADVTEGGVLGATLLLQHWLGISPAISSFLMNTACYALGWKVLGKNFLAYSFLAAAGYSAGYRVWEQYPPLFPQIADYPFAAAVIGALFIGIGAGICVRAGGATTGDDALAMSISAAAKIPIARVYLITDLTVLLLSLSYIPVKRIAFSLLTVILSGQIIGWLQPKNKCG